MAGKQKAISISNLSKSYTIGTQKESSLRVALSGIFKNKENSKETFWALKDVSFDIKQGDVIGIIGRNGAGKSTLLKILSKITQPTEGRIEINGRVASLLEVGTGFHPELTGRENIYLNGTLLGMTRKEVTNKLDEIVEFSGVRKFIDTPVKHYSSGMYVRLAFSVAAHLEPEILIVDEVLAVGDAEFQKKCLGKMSDIAGEGRTVIFVSHDLVAIQNLCEKCVLLDAGKIEGFDLTHKIIEQYLSRNEHEQSSDLTNLKNREGSGVIKFNKIEWTQKKKVTRVIDGFNEILLEISLNKEVNKADLKIDIGINNSIGTRITWLSNRVINLDSNNENNKITFKIDQLNLMPGAYNCNLFMEYQGELSDWITGVGYFEIGDFDYYKTGKLNPKNQGYVLLNYKIS